MIVFSIIPTLRTTLLKYYNITQKRLKTYYNTIIKHRSDIRYSIFYLTYFLLYGERDFDVKDSQMFFFK